jgi:hypothetical protein
MKQLGQEIRKRIAQRTAQIIIKRDRSAGAALTITEQAFRDISFGIFFLEIFLVFNLLLSWL